MKLYGLKTCDSCRKALKWLKAAGREIEFVDVRGDDFERADIERIVAAAGWQVALNRKSATWRSLDEAERMVSSDQDAAALIAAHPALLKRPVIVVGERTIVGFGAGEQALLTDLIG
jgi:arsenate reductase